MSKQTSYKTKRVINCLETKLGMDLGAGKEQTAWYRYENRKITRVTIPHQHGGGKGDSLSPEVYKDLKNKLFLSPEQFNLLYECPLGAREYIGILKTLNIF